MLRVPLTYTDLEASHIVLEPMCGHHEYALSQTASGSGLRQNLSWLSSRIVSEPNSLEPENLDQVAMCDFDRVVAAVYAEGYGPDFNCTVACQACEAKFEFTLTPDILFAPVEHENLKVLSRGRYQLDDVTFRFPRVRDVLQAQSPESIIAQATLEGSWDAASDAERAFSGVCGVGRQDISATCPECGEAQTVLFDIQDFTLKTFARDTHVLFSDIHALAQAYGWRFEEILNLPKPARRDLAGRITQQHAVSLRARRVA